MTILEKLETLIEPSLTSLGYELVRLLYWGERQRVLQIMIERIDQAPVGIEDCVKVSHHLSALLDVEDIIEERYNLEVTSPGAERPLIKLKDFLRFQGQRAKMESVVPIQGRKRFVGIISHVENEVVFLQGDDFGEISLPYPSIQKAKLVLEESKLPKSNKNQ